MSKLKISENLFLGVAELNRFQKFMEEDGFKRHFLLNTDSFGLIRQATIPEIGDISVADNFYVSKAGTPTDQVIINKGVALDSNGDLILKMANSNLSIPNDSIWYWVKIKHEYSLIEKGTLSVDSLGNVIGTGTELTKVLRGQPNFASKIKFTNSVNGNADEYEVVSVLSDSSMIIQGDFIAETGLQYTVIGTFTPGFVPDTNNKSIFRYDSVNISLVPELSLDTAPAYVENVEFYIARVRNNGATLSLEDKRIQWWQSEATNSLNNLDRNLSNPLIGVENVKWDIPTSDRSKNWIEMAWGMRFDSWTVDTSSKTISILIGQGGVYKDTSFFQDGDFDGWRIYSAEGKYQNIISSTKTGSQIVIILDVLNPEDYIANDLLFVTPAFEEIEVRIRKDSAILDTEDIDSDADTAEPFPFPSIEEIFNFSINTPLARFRVPAQTGNYKYNLTYRYKTFNGYSEWLTFPDDAVGYYKETSFDIYGNLKSEISDRVRYPYVGHPINGFIEVVENSYSFDIFQQTLNTGDLFGVNTTAFSNATPLINLRVTNDKKYQHFTGLSDLTLGGDIYIALSSFKDAAGTIPCREGNHFYIHISQYLNMSTFKIRIVENFVNPSSYDLVAELNQNDACYIKNNTILKSSDDTVYGNGMMITCTFNDLGHWVASYDTEMRPVGSIEMKDTISSSNFDVSGNGVKAPYFGWRIFTEIANKFPFGAASVAEIDDEGGSNSVTLGISNMPAHTHDVPVYNSSAAGGSSIETFEAGDPANPAIIVSSSVGGGVPFDNRPAFYKFLFIKKIV